MTIKSSNSDVKYRQTNQNDVGQRIDNYLFKHLKGVPKSHIYRIIRKGEVRVNKKRVKPDYHLKINELVRIPPVKHSQESKAVPPEWLLNKIKDIILYEDDDLLILNKPVGVAVHAGSGIEVGLVEALRYTHKKSNYLELIHRLDKETSGCLLFAKNAQTLKEVHSLLRNEQVEKIYYALVKGHWDKNVTQINAPLLKNQLQSGERMVFVNELGKKARTYFKPLKYFNTYPAGDITVTKFASLIEAKPQTGRTHQIRVHAKYAGHVIAGDLKYGDKDFNRQIKNLGCSRLLLHAARIKLQLPQTQKIIDVTAPLDAAFTQLLAQCDNS